jgi:hypothetical protein
MRLASGAALIATLGSNLVENKKMRAGASSRIICALFFLMIVAGGLIHGVG